MLRSILFSALLLLSFGSVMAQDGPPQGRGQRQNPEEMANSRADLFQEEFGLSDEQRTKVYDLILTSNKETREKIMEARDSGADRETMRKVMTDNAESVEKELKKIFTAEQWTAYEKWRKENPMQPQRRRRGGK